MDGDVGITRRGFLGGLLAAGTLAACTRDSPQPTRVGPSTRVVQTALSVGLIGAGAQGRALANRLAHDRRVSLLAVCDPDSERAAKLAIRLELDGHRRPSEVEDLRRMLDDERIDAVVIATPHHWHALAAIWALQSGKHVYLEKPATHSLAEGDPLLAAANASGRVVEVGTQRRSHPGLAEAIAAVHAGVIGDVRLASCYSWRRRHPIGRAATPGRPNTLNADLWFGPRPIVPPVRESFHYDWHWFYEYGNGGLGNNGVHRLDVARWGLQLSGPPTTTLSLAGRLGPVDCGQTPNTALTLLQFRGATVAHDLRGLRTAPTATHDPGMAAGDEVVFVGDGASIAVNRVAGRLIDADGRVVRHYGVDAADTDPMARHLRGFVDACLAEDPAAVAVGTAEGVAAAAMCHAPTAAHRSAGEAPASLGPEELQAAIHQACGPLLDAPAASFLAHVQRRGDVDGLAWTGMRTVHGNQVAGTPETATAYPYRAGYRWDA